MLATPIAEKVADLSGYFLIVLCAIFLEKYLLTLTGYATFTILIPRGLRIAGGEHPMPSETVKQLAKKLAILDWPSFLVVPASVKVSNLIEETYSASIESTLAAAKEATEEIEASAEAAEKADSGLFSSVVGKVQEEAAKITARVQNVLNNFIEALAVMLVTSCVIPMVVLIFFVWLIKSLFGVTIALPRLEGR